MPPAPLRRIADHAVIGNLSTVALVATDGAIDFMCWPQFDSPTIFAALLDADLGGHFQLSAVMSDGRVLQMYVPETNLLLTRWLGEEGSAEVVDLMPAPDATGECVCRVVRRVRATRGTVRMRLRCAPRFDYARVRPTVEVRDDGAHFAVDGFASLRLRGAVRFEVEDAGVSAEFELRQGESIDFVLDESDAPTLEGDAIGQAIDATTRYWLDWAARSSYRGRWRDTVMRSALLLKLLTSNRYGSMVAAATFGLPESRGGPRNWDYRATWVRDASFAVYGLMRLGYHEEGVAFTRWVADRAAACPNGRLQVMYRIDGSPEFAEETLDLLAGHGGARPVRIGNAAATQLQLDIYGELMDSIYLSNKYGEAISHQDWRGVCRVVDHVCEVWREPDAGIWEMRNAPAAHLHSRLMCWVAVDRAIRLASKRSLAAPFAQWIQVRSEISEDIWSTFWDAEAGHFVNSPGTEDLDGAMLMMPLVRFIGARDPAWLATLDAIGKRLTDGLLVLRYDGDDGLDGREGAFTACAFWYVECLARAGRMVEARTNFEKLLLYGNHVRLYSEELDARGDQVGNFPQAFTHLALISAAFYLDREIGKPAHTTWPA